jgi:hypothetical protein
MASMSGGPLDAGTSRRGDGNRATDDVVRILVDDVRVFRDGRPCFVVTDVQAAIELLEGMRPVVVDELWLDYDLGGGATSLELVNYLVAAAARGEFVPVARIHVHSSNVLGAFEITKMLRAAGYLVEREYNKMLWTRRGGLPTDNEI